MSESRRLLVVSYFYPPDPAVGGRRVAKFVQYLPEFGWAPTVLTARTIDAPPHAGDVPVHATRSPSPWSRRARNAPAGDAKTGSLRERLGRGGRLKRGLYFALRHALPMSSVRMPDATLGWVRPAVAEGKLILAEGHFDAIVSSSGPPSSHIVAARLQRHSGLPWVADYRDLWSDNHWDMRVAPFRWLERRLERRVLRGASALTTVAPTWARHLEQLHNRPVEVVFNGFDPQDYPPAASPASSCVIIYSGPLLRPGQRPEPLSSAIAHLAARLDLESCGFEPQFLGTAPGIVEPLAQRHGVARWVRLLPSVPYHESLARQAAASALLFLGWADPAQGWLSAKLFEYLGAGRPILAVGPQGGDASRILHECGLADLTEDPSHIADLLEGWVREFQHSGAPSVELDQAAVSGYTRRSQTERLARLLDRLIGSPT